MRCAMEREGKMSSISMLDLCPFRRRLYAKIRCADGIKHCLARQGSHMLSKKHEYNSDKGVVVVSGCSRRSIKEMNTDKAKARGLLCRRGRSRSSASVAPIAEPIAEPTASAFRSSFRTSLHEHDTLSHARQPRRAATPQPAECAKTMPCLDADPKAADHRAEPHHHAAQPGTRSHTRKVSLPLTLHHPGDADEVAAHCVSVSSYAFVGYTNTVGNRCCFSFTLTVHSRRVSPLTIKVGETHSKAQSHTLLHSTLCPRACTKDDTQERSTRTTTPFSRLQRAGKGRPDGWPGATKRLGNLSLPYWGQDDLFLIIPPQSTFSNLV